MKRLYTSQPSNQMQNISFCQVWACMPRRQCQFQDFSTFPPLLFFRLFLRYLFSSAGHLVVFNSVGNIWGKAFRILKLNERKGRRVLQQDSHGNFWPNVILFFCLFLWPHWLNCARHSSMVWKISSSCTSYMELTNLSSTVKNDNVTSGTRDMDQHGWFRENSLG